MNEGWGNEGLGGWCQILAGHQRLTAGMRDDVFMRDDVLGGHMVVCFWGRS